MLLTWVGRPASTIPSAVIAAGSGFKIGSEGGRRRWESGRDRGGAGLPHCVLHWPDRQAKQGVHGEGANIDELAEASHGNAPPSSVAPPTSSDRCC